MMRALKEEKHKEIKLHKKGNGLSFPPPIQGMFPWKKKQYKYRKEEAEKMSRYGLMPAEKDFLEIVPPVPYEQSRPEPKPGDPEAAPRYEDIGITEEHRLQFAPPDYSPPSGPEPRINPLAMLTDRNLRQETSLSANGAAASARDRQNQQSSFAERVADRVEQLLLRPPQQTTAAASVAGIPDVSVPAYDGNMLPDDQTILYQRFETPQPLTGNYLKFINYYKKRAFLLITQLGLNPQTDTNLEPQVLTLYFEHTLEVLKGHLHDLAAQRPLDTDAELFKRLLPKSDEINIELGEIFNSSYLHGMAHLAFQNYLAQLPGTASARPSKESADENAFPFTCIDNNNPELLQKVLEFDPFQVSEHTIKSEWATEKGKRQNDLKATYIKLFEDAFAEARGQKLWEIPFADGISEMMLKIVNLRLFVYPDLFSEAIESGLALRILYELQEDYA